MTCPTCGCPTHSAPRTWEVVCGSCGEKRWPCSSVKPEEPFTCTRCRNTSRARREAAREAGKRSAEARGKALPG